ncbi:MAG: formyltetrahydrofolate deformylase [Pseudomonadota bacterium]
MQQSWILCFSCPDRAGVQAFISTFIHAHGGFIANAVAHSDPETNQFFSRILLRPVEDAGFDFDEFSLKLGKDAEAFSMDWSLTPVSEKMPTVIAVSKFGHCLNDILHRWKTGALPIDVRAIVSNHETMRPMAEFYGLPYHHIPVTKKTKMECEAAFLSIVEQSGAELVVLARYMQILSDGLSAKWAGKCINIHHSFLPSFKGAKPYHQAYQRGVKLIGATAHYVTSDLDEGPIIEQDVERVDHTQTPALLVEQGRDIEARVLSRAIKWHASRRVFMIGRRTIVLR